MNKYDIYLYEDCRVLKNLLNIKDEAELDIAEAELSRANMMIIYENGFSDFSPSGVCKIHKALFGDVYEWAGKYRIINIIKREDILAGVSVWYSDCDNIERDLNIVFDKINNINWKNIPKNEFTKNIAKLFSEIWQIHPFREGNTRTVVMLMTFFIEYFGYYFDQQLIAECAGYMRNAFVLASLGENSEYEHLEKILNDAISEIPIQYDDSQYFESNQITKKYQTPNYKPKQHEYSKK